MFTSRRFYRVVLTLLPLFALVAGGCAVLTPEFSYQGRLLDDDGKPVSDGDYEMMYRLYHQDDPEAAVFTDTLTIPVKNGLFTTVIGSQDLDPTVFAEPVWMEVTVEGETLSPRQRLQGSPYAFSLVPGAVVQGDIKRDRSFQGQADTGAVLTAWNNDNAVTGGHALLAINQAAPKDDERNKTAALLAIAAGGNINPSDSSQNSGAYGAIIRSENYRGMYARGGDEPGGAEYFAAVFDSKSGINLIGGGSCGGCTTTYMGYNAGEAAIAPGDFVSLLGVELDEEFNVPVMQVQKATTGDTAVIGVATAAAARESIDAVYGAQVGGFEYAQGTAEAGSYVNVAVQGLVQANVGSASGMALGQQLQGAQGVQAAAGRLMSAPDGDGIAWVMLSGN